MRLIQGIATRRAGTGERRRAAGIIALAVMLVATTAAATETVTLLRDDLYTLGSSPSQASRCEIGDIVYPATLGTMKTFKKTLDSVIAGFPFETTFECKAELYRGPVGNSCGAYKLTACVCQSNCGGGFGF